MPYKYPGNTANNAPNIPLRATNNAPMDERIVIKTRLDLVTPETWGPAKPTSGYFNHTYDGIIVSVVDDDTPANNGVYYLLKRSKYLTFADVDPSEPNYNPEGWRKIGTEGGGGGETVTPDNYTIKDGTAEPSDSDTRHFGFHVVRVDGGNFN